MRSSSLLSTDAITNEPPTTQVPPDAPAARHHPAANGGAAANAAEPARSRTRKFVSYYKPYQGLFAADMACALIVSAVTLALPLCAQYITKNLLAGTTPHALSRIALMGALMLGLVGLLTLCTMF